MFVTKELFEQHVPRELAEPGSHYHHAMLLSSESPFYLATCSLQGDRAPVQQTIAVSWETTLIDMLRDMGKEALVAISVVTNRGVRGAAWKSKAVKRLWLPVPSEEARTGPLLLETEDEDGVYDTQFLKPVPIRHGRQLIWSQQGLPPSAAQPGSPRHS